MTSRLILQGIDLKLGSFRLALDLDVQLGCLGILGPSGSGKTTLLELIVGLRRLRHGQVSLGGVELTDPDRNICVPVHQRRIGYVPQDLALFSHLSVLGNILYGAPENKRQSGETAPTLEAVCAILELTPFLQRRPDTLSGGEKQRVALARALVAEPRALLLDEPLTGLDQDRKDTALNYLQLLRRRWDIPMIYVSHQPEEIATLCDHVVVLCDGNIRGQGSAAEVFEVLSRPTYRLRTGLGTVSKPGHVAQ